jgi:two-component system cell cycle sensor histidine kinase/response regulator CckA
VKKHGELRLQLSSSLVPTKVDPELIGQALVNLVLNACDAISSEGLISIETASVDFNDPLFIGQEPKPGASFVRLTVSDNGKGISAEVKDRIFEPFFTTKGVGKGAGLGLSAVYGIAQQAGGFVAVESSAGSGTRVSLILPAQPQPSPRTSTATILLVEDEDALRSLVCEVLQKRGFQVLAARDAIEALQAFQKAGRIDLLLTDIRLGEMSGTELAHRLSKDYPSLGILLTSGYLPDQPLTQRETPHEFLAKPFTPDALLAKIDEMLNRSL